MYVHFGEFQISVLFLEDYGKLVRVMIFLKQTMKEEIENEHGIYTQDMQSIYYSIRDVMCKFRYLEPRCGQEEHNFNATDIVQHYAVHSSYSRPERDYVFLKDLWVLLSILEQRYNLCSSHYTRQH